VTALVSVDWLFYAEMEKKHHTGQLSCGV